MYIFTVTISTDAGGRSWILSAKLHLTIPPHAGQQIVFDVSEDEEERLALAFHIAHIRHYIEEGQDANFVVVEASPLDVEPDVAHQLVKGLVNFLGEHVTECVEDLKPWYSAALVDYKHFMNNDTSPSLKKLLKTIPDGSIALLNDRKEFMVYYELKWDDGIFRDLSGPESSEPASDE